MGMSGIALGSFVQGASDGYDRARKRGIEDERQKWEREDHDDKQRMRDAQKEFAAQMQAAREQFATGKLPGQEENLVPQQAPVAAPSPDAQPVRQGIATSDAAPQAAAPQGAAPAAPAPADNPVSNIFKSNGEGLYKNQKQANDAYWNRLRDITANYYEKTNQVDKLMDIDKKIGEWKSSSYDELRKATAAAIATGDPGALKMASHLADLTGLGAKLDPSNATYDSKTQTWNNVKTIGPDGKEHVENLTAQSLLTTIGHIAPEKLIEWNVGRQDKERQFGIEERKAKAEETKAGAAATNARTNEAVRTSNEGINNEIRTRNYFDSFYGASKDFQVKDPKDMLTMTDQQKADYEIKRERYEIGRHNSQLASSLYSLNPGMKPGEITAFIGKLSKNPNAKPDGQDANGSYYFNVGGKKVVMPAN